MNTAELRFFQLAEQIAGAAVQAATAYNQCQAQLNLEAILTPGRLCTQEGTRESLGVIGELERLTREHKAMFANFTLRATQQLLAALAELPMDRQEAARQGLAESVNRNMAAQSAFYQDRETWIKHARALCHLIDENRARIAFQGDTLLFQADEPLVEFNRLVECLDNIHAREVTRYRERQARIMKSVQAIKGES